MEGIFNFLEWLTKFFIYTLLGLFFIVIFLILAALSLPFLWILWLCEPFNFKIINYDKIFENKEDENNKIENKEENI